MNKNYTICTVNQIQGVLLLTLSYFLITNPDLFVHIIYSSERILTLFNIVFFLWLIYMFDLFVQYVDLLFTTILFDLFFKNFDLQASMK